MPGKRDQKIKAKLQDEIDRISNAKGPLALNLSHNNIGEYGVRLLVEAILQEGVAITLLTLKLSDIKPKLSKSAIASLSRLIREVQFPLTLDLSSNEIGGRGIEILSDAIIAAQFPLTLNLSDNNIGYDIEWDYGVEDHIARAIREARVPLTLDLGDNNDHINDDGWRHIAKAVREAKIPIAIELPCPKASEKEMMQHLDLNDVFVIEARTKPSEFLERLEFGLARKMLRQTPLISELLYRIKVKDIALIIQEYSADPYNLAWTIVRAIRAVKGASKANKYSSIDYALLGAVYFDTYVDYPNYDNVYPTGIAGLIHSYLGDSYLVRTMVDAKRYQFTNLLKVSGFISREVKSVHINIPEGYVDVPGDGLCFYHAVARQLGVPDSGEKLQQMAINEVMNNIGIYNEFIPQHGGVEGFFNYHLQRQESNAGGWADNIMIQALANALDGIGLHYVIEVYLFDHAGNAIIDDSGNIQVRRIEPHNNPNAPVLRIGNINNLHFVAADNGPIPANNADGVVRLSSSSSNSSANNPNYSKVDRCIQELADKTAKNKEDCEARLAELEVQEQKIAKANMLNNQQNDNGVDEQHRSEDEEDSDGNTDIDEGEEELDWEDDDGAPTKSPDDSFVPTPAPTVISVSSLAPTPNATSQAYYETLEFGDASSFELGIVLSGMDSTIINI
jgi:hypothetical protein